MVVNYLYFNPRSHERSDYAQDLAYIFVPISIHAPTRGATCVQLLKSVLIVNFNPRSHERSDKKSVDDGDMMSISIHAPTRGATLSGSVQLKTDFKFQSTLPREERHNDMEYMRDMDKFQSTLPREERPATLQSGT